MKLKEQGFKIVAINYKDNPSNAKQFLEKYQNPFQEILLDPKGSLAAPPDRSLEEKPANGL